MVHEPKIRVELNQEDRSGAFQDASSTLASSTRSRFRDCPRWVRRPPSPTASAHSDGLGGDASQCRTLASSETLSDGAVLVFDWGAK